MIYIRLVSRTLLERRTDRQAKIGSNEGTGEVLSSQSFFASLHFTPSCDAG